MDTHVGTSRGAPCYEPKVRSAPNQPLLGERDSAPARIVNEGGRSDILLVGDHAGNAIPSSLGDLGLSAADRHRHIAWDLGVRALGEHLAQTPLALPATAVNWTARRRHAPGPLSVDHEGMKQ